MSFSGYPYFVPLRTGLAQFSVLVTDAKIRGELQITQGPLLWDIGLFLLKRKSYFFCPIFLQLSLGLVCLNC